MKKAWTLLAASSLCATALFAAQFPPAVDVTIVRGLVTEYGTGKELSNITVSLTPARSAPAPNADLTLREQFRILVTRRASRTDPDGRFEIEEVDPGDYYILAERRGYIRPGEADPRGRLISIPDDTRGVVGLEILPGGVIEGHVFDEAGDPLRGLQVVAQTWAYGPDGRVLRDVVLPLDPTLGRAGDPLDTSVTGREGAYRLEGLMPGEYQIAARRRTLVATGEEGGDEEGDTQVWGPVYYPSADRADGAGPIHIDTGARVSRIDIGWKPVPTITIRGHIEGAPGVWDLPSLLDQGFLELSLSETGGESSATLDVSVDPEGAFEILAVGSRSYTLEAKIDGTNASAPYVGRMTLDVGDSDEDDVVVTVEGPVPVSGRIIPASPLPGGFQMNQLRVGLVDVASGTPSIGIVYVGQDGTFSIDGLARIDYHVQLYELPAGTYLESGRYGFADPLMGRFSPGDDPGASLELRIAASPGRVEGMVRMPVEETSLTPRVSLVPQGLYRDRYDLYRQGEADREGHFSIENVPPGSYRVFAWNIGPDRFALMDSWFILPFEGLGTFVQVEAAGFVEVEVNLIIR